MNNTLIKLFDLKLTSLSKELTLYADETKLWKIDKGISNSGGNLTLHLIGNLNHFIGAILGGTGYQRDREAEFNLKNIPVKDLLNQIEATKLVVKKTIDHLNPTDFEAIYPIQVFGTDMTTGYFLIHLIGHFNYHLGQINYHRRLIC